ncbi:MarR family winged helix-turn-helix transcriptional regulator [Phytohabitans rumicis]|uniref:MarR family transcriptional regulator n=2 Tax=Phytohabitans rumicis TaxID=1076125 RepID=A0A6V8LM54_9ACTN|nr:MarR family transcriptional regulator [Phytohabitans rumicis]GFJ95256.1 MarR family transcriptional regulator [Phytohabitans rumicis]
MDNDETAEELSFVLGRFHQVLRRAAVHRAGREMLPNAQVELLRLVEQRPGVSVKEAAEALRMAANTVSTLVGDLVDAGLLARTRAPEDRRSVRLDLTEAARERLAAYATHRRALVADALAQLDADARRDLARATPHLRRLADLVAGED